MTDPINDHLALLADTHSRRLLIALERRNPRSDGSVSDSTPSQGHAVDRSFLRRVSLPMLAADDYVAWDRAARRVTRGPRFAEISPLVRLLIDHVDAPDGRTTDDRPDAGVADRRRRERLASVVAHDLQNPLTVLRGSLDLAERTGNPSDFARCRTAVERIEALLDDLSVPEGTAPAVDAPASVDVGAAIRRSWETVDTANATLVVDTDRRVRADGSRLRELLENLIRNAAEHGSSEARDVRALDDAVDTVDATDTGSVTITVGDLPDGFYVEDDGRGIPETERDRVFEWGYSARSEGTGLGLAIVREICEAHGWGLRVVAGRAGGARFEVTEVTEVDARDDSSDDRAKS